MSRMSVAIVMLALVGLVSGCASCATPYDNCGPTFIDPGCDTCTTHDRLGSILGPGGYYNWDDSGGEYYTDEPVFNDEYPMSEFERDEWDQQR